MQKILRKKKMLSFFAILALVLFASAQAFAADAVVAGQAAGSSIQLAAGNVVATPIVVSGASAGVGAAGGVVVGGITAGVIAATAVTTSSQTGSTTKH